MPIRRVHAERIDFTALRTELDLPDSFPPAAQEEAERAAMLGVGAERAAMPGVEAKQDVGARADLTDVPFVTIDPPGSLDLDQALHLDRRPGGGYRVRYAIADVSAFVRPGGALWAETWRRGETVYLPDGKVPLHPTVLSEGAASLLPGKDRPAVVWSIDVDSSGETVAVEVRRATVRSRTRFDYVSVQANLPEPLELLPAIGALLIERGLAKGAINLPIPAQEVEPHDGGWRLALVAPTPVENFNAQLSLLTGRAAAQLMLDGRVGLLRTMPPPPPGAFEALRRAAVALRIDWPEGTAPGRVIAAVDPADPRGAAFLDQAGELLRGAGYTAFDGELPEQVEQAAVAAPYAHVTAPLRRLADRYATEVCLALTAGEPVPDWARESLPKLPAVMSGSDSRAGAANRGAVDLTEAVLLQNRVGEHFEAAVVDVEQRNNGRPPRAVVAIDDPAVRARCEGADFTAGTRIGVVLKEADPTTRKVLFQKA